MFKGAQANGRPGGNNAHHDADPCGACGMCLFVDLFEMVHRASLCNDCGKCILIPGYGDVAHGECPGNGCTAKCVNELELN